MNTPLPASIAAAIAGTANADAPPLELRQFLIQTLRIEALDCWLDDDRDIVFRHQGFALCLRVFDDDPEFVQLVLPHFHTVPDAGDLPRCLMVADRVNQGMKCVKIVTTPNGAEISMHATAEFLMADARQIAPVVLRAASALISAVRDFRTVLRIL